jgi:hypothetical protein
LNKDDRVHKTWAETEDEFRDGFGAVQTGEAFPVHGITSTYLLQHWWRPGMCATTNTGHPLKHWCFLGEITDVSSLLHLGLELEDLDHKRSPLHFYTEQKGQEVDVAQLRVGNTVAVLYAQRYSFVHGNPGIRHENLAMFRVTVLQ